MALTWIKLANFALSKLGAKSITSLGDGTTNSNACNLLLDQSIDEVLSVHDWNCATKRAELSQSASTPLGDEWDYYYDIPADCLRAIDILDTDSDWELEGRYILCNEESVNLKYVGRIDNPLLIPPYLIDAIACHLASRLANTITEPSSGLEGRMYSEYEASLLRARWQNAIEDNDEDEEELWTTRS